MNKAINTMNKAHLAQAEVWLPRFDGHELGAPSTRTRSPETALPQNP